MILAPKKVARRILLFPIVVGLSACAAGLPDVEPVDIPRLEQRVAGSPDDTDLQVQLGMAQFKNSDFAEEQAILENRWSNVLAFLAYGRGLRELDQGNYAAAESEFETAMNLDPGAFPGAGLAMEETAALIDAAATSTDDLGSRAGATGETGLGVVGPPTANTVVGGDDAGLREDEPVGAAAGTGAQEAGGNTLNTLRNISEGVDPTPTAGTLDLGSAIQGQEQTTQQTKDTVRDPVQERNGDDIATNAAVAQIRIVIRRPGGER